MSVDFNCQRWVANARQKASLEVLSQHLQDLSTSLKVRFAIAPGSNGIFVLLWEGGSPMWVALQTELVEIVHRDYADFVNGPPLRVCDRVDGSFRARFPESEGLV
jgi:hypothetical protein